MCLFLLFQLNVQYFICIVLYCIVLYCIVLYCIVLVFVGDVRGGSATTPVDVVVVHKGSGEETGGDPVTKFIVLFD